MKIRNFLTLLILMLLLNQHGNIFAMFPGGAQKYLTSQDLDARKRAMRESLDEISNAIRPNLLTGQEQPATVLQKYKEAAQAIANTTAQTDPQMGRRARDIVRLIDSKLKYQMETD